MWFLPLIFHPWSWRGYCALHTTNGWLPFGQFPPTVPQTWFPPSIWVFSSFFFIILFSFSEHSFTNIFNFYNSMGDMGICVCGGGRGGNLFYFLWEESMWLLPRMPRNSIYIHIYTIYLYSQQVPSFKLKEIFGQRGGHGLLTCTDNYLHLWHNVGQSNNYDYLTGQHVPKVCIFKKIMLFKLCKIIYSI